MTDTTTTTIGITTPVYRPITTWYEQMQADWAAETAAAYDASDAIDYPVTLDEQVTAAMMLMVDDLEQGTQDSLAWSPNSTRPYGSRSSRAPARRPWTSG